MLMMLVAFGAHAKRIAHDEFSRLTQAYYVQDYKLCKGDGKFYMVMLCHCGATSIYLTLPKRPHKFLDAKGVALR